MAGTYTPEERIQRLEQVVGLIAEGQLKLEEVVTELGTFTRRGFDFLAELGAETDRRMRQTDERMRQTDERMRQTDESIRQLREQASRTDEQMRHTTEHINERMDKLIVAIGEFMRQRDAAKP